MSEPMTCPGCGAEECRRYHCYEDDIVEFQCRTEWYVDPEGGHLYPIDGDVSHGCLHRRLAQRDERNAALEAEIVELRRAINGIAPTDPTRFEDLDLCVALNNHADLAAVAPVVRAAATQVRAREEWTALIDSAASAAYYDACETTEEAARALPADVRERITKEANG